MHQITAECSCVSNSMKQLRAERQLCMCRLVTGEVVYRMISTKLHHICILLLNLTGNIYNCAVN